MKRLLTILVVGALLIPFSGSLYAQSDPFGAIDTLYAKMDKIGDYSWMVTVSLFNDEKIVALSVPLKITADEGNRVAVDSVVYTGGRAEHFTYKVFRADTTAQSVTMGLIANMGPTNKTLHPGNGRVATVFVSSLDKKPMANLHVDTTTTPPANSLMGVADRIQGGDTPDTIPSMGDYREIRPSFVIREK